jgi:ubiquinone/menaquinone biosynthesis C-methylase UbiE
MVLHQYDIIGRRYAKLQRAGTTEEPKITQFIISSALFEGKRILDLGCGTGDGIRSIRELNPKAVYGLDISGVMLKEAVRTLGGSKNLVLGSMESIPFENSSFDIVTAKFCLPYVANLDNTYSEISRVLETGGLLIAVVHHPLMGFVELGSEDYRSGEDIKIKLGEKVEIFFPHHTLGQYFSEVFFSHFVLGDLKEIDTRYADNSNNIPSDIGFKAVKKESQ